jgi:GrpB-like predicted nucleotidyltransferase (UPF0157 family)
MRTIVVAPYDPAWPVEFARIRDYLWPHVNDLALDVVHVGSTGVPGLAAKPVIDLHIVMESYAVFPALKARLESLGYRHNGDQGVPTREAFKDGPEGFGFMKYHLYVSPQDGLEYRRHILFRDWLRGHDEDRDAYGELKRLNARLYPHDIDAYIAGKSDLREEIIRKACEAHG